MYRPLDSMDQGWGGGGGVIKVANKLGKLQQYDHDLH